MALIYDLADMQELQGFVRNVQAELDANRFLLSRFLPNDNIDEITWSANQGTLSDEDAADIRAWDTESTIGAREGLSRIFGELVPMSRKYRIGEEEKLRRRALERGSNAELVRAIFDDAAKGARSISGRVELLRGEALERGRIDIDENGVKLPVPYNRDAALSVTAGTAWTNPAATTIQQEKAWLDIYKSFNDGQLPAVAMTSQARLDNLALNTQYLALSTGLAAATPPFLSPAQINAVRAQFGLPPLFIYDTEVRINGTPTRVISADKVIYLPPADAPLGKTFIGTTAEALEIAEARQLSTADLSGMTAVVTKRSGPVSIWTDIQEIALPVLVNPNMTLVADVAA